MAAGLRFFTDDYSQPCRAITILLQASSNEISYEPVAVNFMKSKFSTCRALHKISTRRNFPVGETKTNEEFLKVCPAQTVPAIDDHGFKLFERYDH